MKSTGLLLTAIIAGTALSAQTAVTLPAERPAASWVLTTSVVSQYMFRGTRLGGAALQPYAEYDRGGLGLGLWFNTPLRDKVVGQSDPEIDFYGSYAIKLNTDVAIVPGFTLYTSPRARERDGFYPVTFEPSLALNYSLGSLQITPKLYYDLVAKSSTAELTAALAVPLKEWGTELDFSGSVGTFKSTDYIPRSTPNVKNWGDYFLIGITVPYQVSQAGKISIGWAYTRGSHNFIKQGTDAKIRNTAALGRGILTLSYVISL